RNIENSKLSDAALLALMCLKVQYQVATWRKFCQLVSDVMPSLPMLEYSRFMRRCKNLIPILQSIHSGLIEMSSYGDIAIIDSFPLPLCQDHRKFRAILFQYFADIGYNATKQKYYYGFKVHVVTDTQGLILNYELTPASIHDAKAAPEVIENCPCPFVIADVGYVGKKL
ncbi:IS982 family transposase, partial [Limosilactobacillus mucosae]